MEQCITCKINKDYIFFKEDSKYKDGYRNKCIDCCREYMKNYNKSYQSKEEKSQRNKKYYQENCEKVKIHQYTNRNKEYERLYLKEYRKENLEKLTSYRREYEVYKRATDDLYRLKSNLRSKICSVVNKKYKKSSKTLEILGCSFEEFKIYLESKFEPWMTWENYGIYNGELNYGWDIDHIIPLSSANTEDELLKLNHHLNLLQSGCKFR